MSNIDVFQETTQKTIVLLKAIEKELFWENRPQQTYHALKVVLHTLRDRLTVEDAIRFSAQLPLLVKGIFFEEWDPSRVPVKLNREEFLAEVEKRLNFLEVEGGPARVVRAVLDNVFGMVSSEEVIKISNLLPKDLVELL